MCASGGTVDAQVTACLGFDSLSSTAVERVWNTAGSTPALHTKKLKLVGGWPRSSHPLKSGTRLRSYQKVNRHCVLAVASKRQCRVRFL